MTAAMISGVSRRIVLGDLKFLVIDEIRRLLVEEKQAAESDASAGFIAREKAQLIRRRSLRDAVLELGALADAIAVIFPTLIERTDKAKELAAKAISAETGSEIKHLIDGIIAFFKQPSESSHSVVTITGDHNSAIFAIASKSESDTGPTQGGFAEALAASYNAQAFLAAVSEMIHGARLEGRKLSGIEQFVRAAAFQTLEEGISLPPAYRGIGVSGFRPYQTSLSLADPGEGHNLVTCLDARLLAGTIVHVEHIDRGSVTDREIVEAYRLPAPLNAARVRLQVGTVAPCTAYIGRAPFENGARPDVATYVPMAALFEEDLLKAAHMTASACSVMFANGIADCKIAMERMTVTQLIRFMEAISGNVLRDRSRQFLSAAFNLNVPLLDDRSAGGPFWIGEKFGIAEVAIELASVGGFEKVAWDGASNLATSEPIIQYFTEAQWLELIHRAHERGLETYVSAGMDKQHMPACVYSGVDGVGIGTSLHYRKQDANGKYIMGELKPDAILEVLQVRDRASATARGRGAETLAILDRLYFEKILPGECDALRAELFAALSKAPPSEEEIRTILCKLDDLDFWKVMIEHKRTCDLFHPVIAQAQRRLIASQSWMDLESTPSKVALHARLSKAIASTDITEIMEVLQ
ncbi:hypothetical protein ACQCPO_15425 [Bacillus mycoides]|uniref:hypothetical protein n=1 Tax=Bacillus mycoides TaxID=1405 RepID=UPI003CEBFEEE